MNKNQAIGSSFILVPFSRFWPILIISINLLWLSLCSEIFISFHYFGMQTSIKLYPIMDCPLYFCYTFLCKERGSRGSFLSSDDIFFNTPYRTNYNVQHIRDSPQDFHINYCPNRDLLLVIRWENKPSQHVGSTSQG